MRVLPIHGIVDGHCTCGRGEKCTKPGKHPRLLRDWPLYATRDEAQIDAWWRSWPDANVAIVTDQLLVIDYDPRKSPIDLISDVVEAQHGPLPATLTARSGSGGAHYYYRAPRAARLRKLAGGRDGLPVGVDVQAGPGAYVIAAPSVHASGDVYMWHDADGDPCMGTDRAETAAIVAAPAWLLELCTLEDDDIAISPSSAPTSPAVLPGKTTRLGRRILERESERMKKADVHRRNNTLYARGRSMFELAAGGEIAPRDVWRDLTGAARYCAKLTDAAGARPSERFGDKEIHDTLVSAMHAGYRNARRVRAPIARSLPPHELYGWRERALSAMPKAAHAQRAAVDAIVQHVERHGSTFFQAQAILGEGVGVSRGSVKRALRVLREVHLADFGRVCPDAPPPAWDRKKCRPGREQTEIRLCTGELLQMVDDVEREELAELLADDVGDGDAGACDAPADAATPAPAPAPQPAPLPSQPAEPARRPEPPAPPADVVDAQRSAVEDMVIVFDEPEIVSAEQLVDEDAGDVVAAPGAVAFAAGGAPDAVRTSAQKCGDRRTAHPHPTTPPRTAPHPQAPTPGGAAPTSVCGAGRQIPVADPPSPSGEAPVPVSVVAALALAAVLSPRRVGAAGARAGAIGGAAPTKDRLVGTELIPESARSKSPSRKWGPEGSSSPPPPRAREPDRPPAPPVRASAEASGTAGGGDVCPAGAPTRAPEWACEYVEERCSAVWHELTGETLPPQHPHVVALGLGRVLAGIRADEKPYRRSLGGLDLADEQAVVTWVADVLELFIRLYDQVGLPKRLALGWWMARDAYRFRQKVADLPRIVARIEEAAARARAQGAAEQREREKYLAAMPVQGVAQSEGAWFDACQRWKDARGEEPWASIDEWRHERAEAAARDQAEHVRHLEELAARPDGEFARRQLRQLRKDKGGENKE